MRVSRRHYFKAFVAETLAWGREVSGTPQLRLSQIDEMSPELFHHIVPIVLPGADLDLRAGSVYALVKGSKPPQVLFEVGSAENFAFNLFNGRHTISQAVALTAQHWGGDNAKAYGCVRDLFLRLAKAGICAPANAVGQSMDGTLHGANRSDSAHEETPKRPCESPENQAKQQPHT